MTITITQPDDWHVHLRDGEMLRRVCAYSAARFKRVLAMPNLDPPVTTVEQALGYRNRILDALPKGTRFDPKMSLYLTDSTSVAEVRAAAGCEHVLGFKYYPAGATTNSASGVTRLSKVMNTLECMSELGVALQVHAEVTDSHVDIFDRESEFIDQILVPLHAELPELKIVIEHITTRDGVDFVKSCGAMAAGTITPHHLLFSRNEIFNGGIRPHLYCLPVLKREEHRRALLEAATSGHPSFFLGTDSAPHARASKESDCGCAGIFSANAAIEIYAGIFEKMDCIDKLEGFASHFGADFYGLPRNTEKIDLISGRFRIPERIADTLNNNGDDLVPLLAGAAINWKLAPPDS